MPKVSLPLCVELRNHTCELDGFPLLVPLQLAVLRSLYVHNRYPRAEPLAHLLHQPPSLPSGCLQADGHLRCKALNWDAHLFLSHVHPAVG